MSWFMLLSDLALSSAFTMAAVSLVRFLIISQENHNKSEYGSAENEHHMDHLLGALFGFISCSLGAAISIIHAFLQNTEPFIVPIWVEFAANISWIFAIMSASIIIKHLTNEET